MPYQKRQRGRLLHRTFALYLLLMFCNETSDFGQLLLCFSQKAVDLGRIDENVPYLAK